MAIEITKFRVHEKNSLKGFFSVRMTQVGLEIRDCTLHITNGKEWIGMPSRLYEKDGQQKWSYILDFYDKNARVQFQEKVLIAIKQYRQKTEDSSSAENNNSGVPF